MFFFWQFGFFHILLIHTILKFIGPRYYFKFKGVKCEGEKGLVNVTCIVKPVRNMFGQCFTNITFFKKVPTLTVSSNSKYLTIDSMIFSNASLRLNTKCSQNHRQTDFIQLESSIKPIIVPLLAIR
jgi:hypothetical protein